MPVILAPANTMPRIDRVWVYLSVDSDGNEGMCATWLPNGMPLPLIAADQERLISLTPIAEDLAKATGMKIVLVEFTGRVELRTIAGRAD